MNKNSNSEFNIRQANETDIEEILKLWLILADYHAKLDPIFEPSTNAVDIARKYIKDHVHKENSSYFLAEHEKSKKIIGYCKGSINDNPLIFKMQKIGQISEIVVDPAYRNRNIGKFLFKEMKKWFSNNNILRIELSVATANPISPKFWEKMGFKEARKILFTNIS